MGALPRRARKVPQLESRVCENARAANRWKRVRRIFFTLFLSASLLPLVSRTGASELTTEATPSRAGWLYFEAPLRDFGDDGLPFRLSLAVPGQRDWITRTLFAAEARWIVSLGYAKVYNSFDGATGIFRNPGGHAALFSAGRQMRWHLPELAGGFTPKLILDLGLHYATRRFPADGTHANIKLITGLEWTWENRARTAEWTAGIVWPHFSNANLLNRNSGYDGLSVRFGRSLRF